MPPPQILIDQVSRPPGTAGVARDDLVTGQLVTLTAPSHPGSGFVWAFVAKPAASVAALANPTTDAPTFTPDVPGSYLVRCIADGIDINTSIGAVKTPRRSYRIPAAGELREFGLEGWGPALEQVLLDVEAQLAPEVVASRIIGRLTAGTGAYEALTGAQATSLLSLFSNTDKGVVPATGGVADRFLRSDGSWVATGVRIVTHVAVGTEPDTGFTVPIGTVLSAATYHVGFFGLGGDGNGNVPWAWAFPDAGRTTSQFEVKYNGGGLTAGQPYKFMIVEA